MFGQSKVSEDVVEYHIYHDDIPVTFEAFSEAQWRGVFEFLLLTKSQALQALSPTMHDFLWQRQGFNLEIWDPRQAPSSTNGIHSSCPHLYGQTAFGDNIEDEWFIVHLLLKLSSIFPKLTIQVMDTDGQFLLIEASDFLPKWVNPETSDNRVFLRGGQVGLNFLTRNFMIFFDCLNIASAVY